MGHSKRVALYLRVSTDGQTTENQRLELERVAQQRGWAIAAQFVDHGISGAKGRDKRPGLDALLKAATRGQFDIVAAWSVDRLGRSLQDLIAFLNELHAAEVGLYLHQQAVDTTTPSGRAMFGMLGVFAEFERALIRERINAGLARAKAKGKKLGRPRVGAAVETAIEQALRAGKGVRRVASELGVGTSTVQRVREALPLSAPTSADQPTASAALAPTM
jgi:DNA invertase Pin-like site-specific DNA recombinase